MAFSFLQGKMCTHNRHQAHNLSRPVDGIIRIYDGPRYIILFGTEKYDRIYDKIRYLIILKSSVTYIFSH